MASEDDETSTLARRQLGRLMRDLRQAIGFTIEQAAPLAELSKSGLQRLEAADIAKLRIRDVQALCEVYEADDADTARATDLAKQAQVKSWILTAFGGLYSDATFKTYVGLEAAAKQLLTYHEIVPGLLQTADYARTLISSFLRDNDPADIDRRVELRIKRQAVITRRAKPVKLEALIHESALHRVVGGPSIMNPQLLHVADIGELPNVSIRIQPYSAGLTWGLFPGLVTILDFGTDRKGRPLEPPLVYLQGSASGNDLYLDKPEDVELYRALTDAIREVSLDERKSRDLLRQVATRRYDT